MTKERIIERRFLVGCIAITACVLLLVILFPVSKGDSFTIERSSFGEWQVSKTNMPDTTIIDTVNIDGIVTFNTTQYIRVHKQ